MIRNQSDLFSRFGVTTQAALVSEIFTSTVHGACITLEEDGVRVIIDVSKLDYTDGVTLSYPFKSKDLLEAIKRLDGEAEDKWNQEFDEIDDTVNDDWDVYTDENLED
jgi:hypothetical protein